MWQSFIIPFLMPSMQLSNVKRLTPLQSLPLLRKIHAFMKSNLTCLLMLITLALSAQEIHAEKADRNLPMNVEADALRYDDIKQISVFTGNVILTKGTIQIRGARVEVRQDPQGFQYGLVTAEPGQLAFFRQKREGVDEFIEGEGETIDYDGRADTVKFVSKAQLRRLQAGRLNDEFKAGLIVYNNTTDVFTLDGTVRNSSGQPGAPSGRVRAMLTPKPESPASAAGPGNLHMTPALGGAPR